MMKIKNIEVDYTRHTILGKIFTQWQLGDWTRVVKTDISDIESSDDSATIALLVATAWFQLGNEYKGKLFIQFAISHNCCKQLMLQILLSGVHYSFGVINKILEDNKEFNLHLQKSVEIMLPYSDIDLITSIRKTFIQSIPSVVISDIPHMEKSGLAHFKSCVLNAKAILEYGSGASTLFALKHGVQSIVTVESSASWIDAVSNQVDIFINQSSKVNLIQFFPFYIDIGAVKAWGRPIDDSQIKNYYKYAMVPWDLIIEKGIEIDCILIDGRFRVACFLASIMNAKPGTVILFDDYVNRTYYHIVEEVVSVNAVFGRMAEFIVPEKYNKNMALNLLLQYSIDYS